MHSANHVTGETRVLPESRLTVLRGSLEATHETLAEALDDAVSRRGVRPALSYFDSRYTFAEVQEHAWALAGYFRELGITKGDRILIQLKNIPQFVFAALAAWELGAVLVPVSPMYRARELKRIAENSEPGLWITTPKIWACQGYDSIDGTSVRRVLVTELTDFGTGVPEKLQGIEAAAGPIREHELVDSLASVIDARRGQRPKRAKLTGDHTALLTYTSGTTGPPKGAITTHANLLWAGHAYPRFNSVVGLDQVLISTAPLVHIIGLAIHLASWLTEGCEFVLNYRFDPLVHLDLMEQRQVTWTTGAATAYTALLREAATKPRNLDSLNFLGNGGAPIPTDMARQIRERFGVELQPGYGLTESTAAVSYTPDRLGPQVDPASGIISVGVPMFDTRLRIADPDGQELPVGERGEVLLKGPCLVSGYWRNPEAAEATFVDGWLRTGDIGFVNANGWLYIVDRTKNMILASGYKVWPREVEDVLYGHPEVREAAVVVAPDPYRGDTVVADVSLEEGNSEGLLDELRDYCQERLAANKVPQRIDVKEEFPENFNGKIQHRELKTEASERMSRIGGDS